MIRKSLLDFWIENNLNVLLKGKHGVGKTACVLESFDAHGLKWAYYSAATMDPWVDFIGVPKPMKSKKTGKTYLGLVRPKAWVEDEIEALFFDEFSRSSSKIRNAVMELIQFKSINGKKFPKLRFIWAATNPDDDDDNEYNVEPIDPAQLDRFHVHYSVPFLPDKGYFSKKFGKEIAEAAIQWWKEIPKELVNSVSPRRLDYAVEIYNKGGDIIHVIPQEANPKKLAYCLSNSPILGKARTIAKTGNKKAAKVFIKDPNSLDCLNREISSTKNEKFRNFWLEHLPEEYMALNCAKDDAVLVHVVQEGKQKEIIDTFLKKVEDELLQYKLFCCFTCNAKMGKNPYEDVKELVQTVPRDVKYYTDPKQVLMLFEKYAKNDPLDKKLSIMTVLAKMQRPSRKEEQEWYQVITQELLNNYSSLPVRGFTLKEKNLYHKLMRYCLFELCSSSGAMSTWGINNIQFLFLIDEFKNAAEAVNPFLDLPFPKEIFSKGRGRGRAKPGRVYTKSRRVP